MPPATFPRRLAVAVLVLAAALPAQRPPATTAPNPERSALERLDELPWERESVGVGIELRRLRTDALFDASQSIAVLDVDLSQPTTRLRVAAPDPFARVPTSTLARIDGALAAVNGGFFDTSNGRPLGLVIQDGVERSPRATRAGAAAVGVDLDGGVLIDVPDDDVEPALAHGLGAWPLLVHAGQVRIDPESQPNPRRHPRTAVGLTGDRRLLLVTVDGRAAQAAGMSLAELAALMRALGCRAALNLDGGGSTTLWIRHRTPSIANHPCDNRAFDPLGERAVANALLVLAPAVVESDEDRAEPVPATAFQAVRDPGCRGGDGLAATAVGAHLDFRVDVPDGGPWQIEVRCPPTGPLTDLEVTVDARPAAIVDGDAALGRRTEAGTLPESPRTKVTIAIRGAAGARFAFDAVRLVERPSRRAR